MGELNGRLIQVFTGSGFQVCTIESNGRKPFPFRAKSKRNGFFVDFSAETAKKLREGRAPNMELI